MSLNKMKSLRTAEKYALQGKIPAAIEEYRKVVEADPGDLTTINTLGDLCVRAGKIQDAIQSFTRIAESYRDNGFTLKAIAMLKKISKLDPTNIDTAMKLANLYSQQGLFVEARQQYLQVADAYARTSQTKKALDAYQKIADLDPANTAVRMKLGEIYSREGMRGQAHDAFIVAGTEFIRKGDTEQALNANLKALTIDPESRQALTAIVNIYTQQGQSERAINILCSAFEKNPGDTELLTILGSTYLAAGRMDEAERTFLSLVELDKNRYHYLLEVGRKFLQMGDLDRAAEQIDGCLEILIARREEDKAIDFLRRILDKDLNHIGSLKQLAQIFMRIREDHNLSGTLNSLVEAAMRQGDDSEAIGALKELARLEPDEPMHRQRLYNLGIRDIVDPGTPDVVRATGPLDYTSAVLDDAFIIRQISEAEILAGHGQLDQSVQMLREILVHIPNHLQVRLKLKDIHLRAGNLQAAAGECFELARLYEDRGESGRASDCLAEGHQLNPLTDESTEAGVWGDSSDNEAGFGGSLGPSSNGNAGFDVGGIVEGFDLTQYETGPLTDQMGFVTVPTEEPRRPQPRAKVDAYRGMTDRAPQDESDMGFRYSDTLTEEPPQFQPATNNRQAHAADSGRDQSGPIPDLLREELEGVDFYVAQGYVEIATDTLNRLRNEHGDHPEILARYQRLAIEVDPSTVQSLEDVTDEELGAAPQEYAPVDFIESEPTHEAAFFDTEPKANTNGVYGAQIDFEDTSVGVFATNDHAPDSVSSESFISPDQFNSLAFGHAAEDDLFVEQGLEGSGRNDADSAISTDSGFAGSEDDARFTTEAHDFESHRPDSIPQRLEGSPARELAGQSGGDFGAQFNTGELLRSTDLDQTFSPKPIPSSDLTKISQPVTRPNGNANGNRPKRPRLGTAELIASIVSDLEDSLDGLSTPPATEGTETALGWVEPSSSTSSGSPGGDWFQSDPHSDAQGSTRGGPEGSKAPAIDRELRSMVEEMRTQPEDQNSKTDYETHYSLGLAYKDMELVDEAIEQFQNAFRMASSGSIDVNSVQCCHMLGLCFQKKAMPKLALMWFRRGLNIPNRNEDEYQALRFEAGLCLEQMGEIENAIDVFTEVYGMDVNYRQVADKLKELQTGKQA